MSVNHTHICTTCDLAQPPGDGFCDDCGTQLVAIRYCDDCGVKALHPGKFCRECGGKLPKIEALPPTNQTTTTIEPAKPVQPAWLNKPEPKPTWLDKPKPKPVQKVKPVSKPRQVVKTVVDATPTDNQAAPLAPRPMAAPVAMRTAPLAPPTRAANTTALVGGAAGALAIVALMANSLPLAIILFATMLIMGGLRLRHTAANGVDGIIDWVWEDPVLRKRILGE